MKNTKKLIAITLFFTLLVNFANGASPEKVQIQITGLTGDALKNAQDRLAIAEASYGPNMSPDSIQTFYKNAGQNIIKAVQPFGYFAAHVQGQLVQHGDQWLAQFAVQPGPALHITHLEIKISGPGSDDPVLQKLLKKFPLKQGDVFEAKKYDDAKDLLFQTANDQGYLKAVFTTKTVSIDLKKYTADIILNLNTGQRYYFGHVTFKQNTYANSFLQRFVNFHEGQAFSSPDLIKFQQNLSTSSFFRDVNVTPDLQQAENNLVPVNVGLEPSKSQQYNFGLGYGTFTGARFTMGTQFRHLTDTGHHLDLQLKVSKVLSGLAAQYVIPGGNPLTDQYTIGANAQRFAPKNGMSISESVALGYIKTLDKWKFSENLTYLREHYDISGDPSHNSRLLYPGIDITRTAADDLINTHSGDKLEFIVRGASSAIVSNVSFLQSDLKGKYIFSPTSFNRVILRGEFGYTTVKDLNTLPLSMQFFAGGLDSVRGFPFSYFGPGRYLKTGSLEVQQHIYGSLSLAAFYDLGMADDHLDAPMGHGIGLGLVYDTPIGPAKIYAGYGYLQDKPRHFALDFSLGPDL